MVVGPNRAAIIYEIGVVGGVCGPCRDTRHEALRQVSEVTDMPYGARHPGPCRKLARRLKTMNRRRTNVTSGCSPCCGPPPRLGRCRAIGQRRRRRCAARLLLGVHRVRARHLCRGGPTALRRQATGVDHPGLTTSRPRARRLGGSLAANGSNIGSNGSARGLTLTNARGRSNGAEL
jgi:hypothetical protein